MQANLLMLLPLCALLLLDNSNACSKCRKVTKDDLTPACRGRLPCYDVMMTLVADGPAVFSPLTDETKLVNHFGLISDDGKRRAISEGINAIDFFRRKYGFDFSHLRDDQLLYGTHTNSEGVSFQATEIGDSADSRYRLYVGTYGDESQLANWIVEDYGFILTFSSPTQARGTNTKLIPPTAIILYGYYIIRPCLDIGNKPCKNIFNPDYPYSPIPIQYNSVDYANFNFEPVTFGDIHCDLFSERFGRGRARGIAIIRDGTNINDVRNVLSFPTYA